MKIIIEGNKGANFVELEKLDDNRIRIVVGDCCVTTARLIVTAEVLSNFLTNISLEANKPLLEAMHDKMTWEKDVNEKFFKDCESFI